MRTYHKTLLLSTSLGALVGGCGDERPPIKWQGDHLRFGTNASTSEICAGTLPYLDSVAGHLAGILGNQHTMVDYYWIPEGPEPYCDPNTLGCHPAPGEAFSKFVVHQHEIVHAVKGPQLLFLPLEEGLAEAYGDDWEPRAPIEGATREVLETYEYGGRMPQELYPRMGHFVAYLRDRFGLEMLLALDEESSYDDSFVRTQNVFEDVFGSPLNDIIADYESSYNTCDNRTFRDRTLDCQRNVVSAPASPDESLELAVPMDCDERTVLGPRLGERWTTVTLDVQNAGEYVVSATRADGTRGRPIRFQRCNYTCFERGGLFLSSQFSARFCLDQTRYLFRFVMDEGEADDYEISVEYLGPSCD